MKIFALLLTMTVIAQAEDIKLDWRPGDSKKHLTYYTPVPLKLSDARPASLKKIPEGVVSPRFGMMKLGPMESAQEFVVMLEETDDEHARIWVDSNADGELTDTEAAAWDARRNQGKAGESITWQGTFTALVSYGATKRTVSVNAYRFGKGTAQRERLKDSIMHYRNDVLTGTLTLDGKSHALILSDDGMTGDYRGAPAQKGSGSNLLIDLNDDKKHDLKAERFDVRQPFNIGGTTYEIAGMTADGSSFQLAISTKTVAEKRVPPPQEIGNKPQAFAETAMNGKPVKFPDDFKDRLVMLDFGATWCGPCRVELPNLVQVYEEFHGKGFDVLGICLENEQSQAKLAKFVTDMHISWPLMAQSDGFESPLGQLFGVHSIPSALLVDGKTGLIVATTQDLRGPALRETIERCLGNLGKPALPAPPRAASRSPQKSAPSSAADEKLISAVMNLAKQGDTISATTFLTQLGKPAPAKLVLPPLSTAPMRGRQIAERAARAYVRAGWVYQCSRCSKWHQSLAGGYAIGKDVIVTAHHVMAAPERMKPGLGHPVIALADGRVFAVKAVLAADDAMDTAVLRVAGTNLQPLGLSADARAGDGAFCLSDPLGKTGYFSQGIVNRVFASNPGVQRINVSTEWAQGSSGAAVLDECGNAIGHVARIEPMLNPKPSGTTNTAGPESRATVLTLHEAVSSASVLKLIEKMNAAVK